MTAHDVALAIAAAGIVVATLVASSTRSLRVGVACGLELLTAAGLLQLAASASWKVIATAAVVVALRKLVSRSFTSAVIKDGIPVQ